MLLPSELAWLCFWRAMTAAPFAVDKPVVAPGAARVDVDVDLDVDRDSC